MKVYKIGIVDDHVLFSEGISRIISQRADFSLSFSINTLEGLEEIIREQAIDILILDVNVPPGNGIQAIEPLKFAFPGLQIMILTMYQPSDIGLQIRNFTGDAYLLKISGKHIFEEALTSLTEHIPYFDPNIIETTIEAVKDNPYIKLTKREKEIIALIAEGKTSKEIAGKLYLSELTIKTHRKNISEKLGSKGVADLILKTTHMR